MTEPVTQTTEAGKADSAPADAPATVACPPFSSVGLRRQLAVDGAFWWTYKIALFAIMGFALFESTQQRQAEFSMVLFLILLVTGWAVYSFLSARIAQQLPRITELIEARSGDAEAMLAIALRRRPLQRSIRLLLYHRLAMLRHQDRRFDETAQICETVLTYNLGLARDVRAHLLLMLTESLLQFRNLYGAWHTLMQLHGCRLNLLEMLQLLALQTRYEVEAGHDSTALQHLEKKIAMAELMPAPQSGALHAILAYAAGRQKRAHMSQWLQQRAHLLCTEDQLKHLWPHRPPSP